MAQSEEIETKQHVSGTTLQQMFCTVTAELIIFHAAVAALREEGVLTTKMVDRIAIYAQQRLQEMKTEGLSPPLASEIGSQLDGLAEQLHRNRSSRLLTEPSQVDNGNGRSQWDTRHRIR
jgi:hypothetical protein